MENLLGRTTKPVGSPPALVFGVALVVALAFYNIGRKPILGGVPRPAGPTMRQGAGGGAGRGTPPRIGFRPVL